MPHDLPLTTPVHEIVIGAFRALKDTPGGLDRDESYLLARLEQADESDGMAALLQAICDAPRI